MEQESKPTRRGWRGAVAASSLSGDLIPATLPDHTGCWGYRLLAEGTLLEIQLTEEEWHWLNEQAMARMNARIDELNQHPLNIAALGLLREAGESPGGPGALRRLHILSLAAIALPWEEGMGDQPPLSEFFAWTDEVTSMEAALQRLIKHEVTPEDLLDQDPHDAARSILDCLGISPY